VLKHGAGEDIGSEVAIAALRTTKGHGNVQAKSHPTIIALLAERPGRRLLVKRDLGSVLKLIGDRRVFILSKSE
jgi:hypothetical protein